MRKTIAVISGDGIGPEIVGQAVCVLQRIAQRFAHDFTFAPAPMGGCAIDAYGKSLPDESLNTCLAADAVLLGAVGGPKWDGVEKENRPEKALLRLRSYFPNWQTPPPCGRILLRMGSIFWWCEN